jgi:hypothetical protein
MTQTEQFEADVAAIEPEGLITFQFEGKDYVCQKTPLMDKLAMADAGMEEGIDFSIDVRASQFTAARPAPSNTEAIVIANVEYRIATTSRDQYGVVITYGVKQST